MKTFIRMFIAIVTMLAGFTMTTTAQTKEDYGSVPAVPIEVFVKGRQEVVRYLLQQVVSVNMRVIGQSVMSPSGWNEYFINKDELQRLGYDFKGLFSDLSSTIASRSFGVKIVRLKNGQYDLRMKLRFMDESGNVLLIGDTWLPVNHTEGTAVSYAEPWVSLPESVNLFVSAKVGGAKWSSGLYEYEGQGSQEFYSYIDSEAGTSLIQGVSTSLIGHGYLAVADWNGNIETVDLANGFKIPVQDVIVTMGKMGSSEVVSVRNPQVGVDDWVGNRQFYRYNGKTYGRFPLLEVVDVLKGYGGVVDFSVPVWGTKVRIYPVSVKVISVDDGKEYNPSPNGEGHYMMKFQIGIRYQILVDFGDQVIDWSAGPALG